MRVPIAVVLLLVASAAAAQEVAAPPLPEGARAPLPNEVICYEKKNFQGASFSLTADAAIADLKKSEFGNWELRITSLKVGEEAVAVLYSSADFQMFCLGLPGKALGGAGYYPNLALVRNRNLQGQLDNGTRSLRVLGKGVDLKKVCDPVKQGPPKIRGRLY